MRVTRACGRAYHVSASPSVTTHTPVPAAGCCAPAGRCVEAGASRVVVAPYFLSRGRHIQDDIPALVAAAREQYPGVTCSIADPIGVCVSPAAGCMPWIAVIRLLIGGMLHVCLCPAGIEPLMVRIMQQRVHAALEQDQAPPAGWHDEQQAAAVLAAQPAVQQLLTDFCSRPPGGR